MIETGEIYHISQNGAPTGHELWSDRPGIVISSSESLQTEGTVKIVYVSSKDRKRPHSVKISDMSFSEKAGGKSTVSTLHCVHRYIPLTNAGLNRVMERSAVMN